MRGNTPFWLLLLTIFIDLLGFGIVIPVLPVFATQIGASAFVVGIIAGVYSLMNFIFAPYWGSLSDKYGRRPVMLFSIAITAIAYVVLGFTTSITILIISRIMAGSGSANISVAQAYITDITAPEKRTQALGFMGVAFGLGFIFGPPVGGFLKTNYGIEGVGFVAAGISTVNLILAYFFLPESLKEKNVDSKPSFKIFSELNVMLKKPLIGHLFYIYMIFISAFAMMQVTVALLWHEVNHFTEAQIGYSFAYVGLCSAIVQGGLVGYLVRTIGESRMIKLGLISMGIGLGSLPFIPPEYFVPFALVSLFLVAMANGVFQPAVTSLIAQNTDSDKLGRVLGLNQSFGSVARITGPIMGGMFYGWDYHAPYVIGAVIMGFCYWIAVIIRQLVLAKLNEEPVLANA